MKRGPKHVWYDDSRAPVVVLTMPSKFDDAALTAALTAATRWLLEEVDAPFGFIADLQRPLAISPRQRKLVASAEAAYAHVDARFNAGQAFVVGSAISRGIVTALTWLSPPVYPYVVVSSIAEAFAWVEPQFDRFLAAHPHGRPT